ncbi:MAG: VRR-NUC domain-containing protein [Ruminiclostridium sp.]
MTVLEKEIEQYLSKEAKKYGGYSLKWVCPSWTGVPDRIIILPQGRIGFIETKAPGKKPNSQQQRWLERLQSFGFLAFKADSKQDIDLYLKMIKEGYQ